MGAAPGSLLCSNDRFRGCIKCRPAVDGRQVSCWDTDRRKAGRNIPENKGVRCNHRTIANVHRTDDARITSDSNVVADGGSTAMGPRPNRAAVDDRAVSSDLGRFVYAYRATMSNEEPRTNPGVWVDVNNSKDSKKLSYYRQRDPRRCPGPSGSRRQNRPLQPVDRERPKDLGAPAGITVLPEPCEFCPARSPLTIACPLLNCVPVVLHWISCFYLIYVRLI